MKSASLSQLHAPGTPITYSYLVTNTGNVTLTSVGVTDPMAGLSAVNCPDASLGPGGHGDLHRDLHHHPGRRRRRRHHQHRHRHGHPPVGSRPITDSVLADGPGHPAPRDRGRQVRRRQQLLATGSPITYSYLVTNTGNVTLSTVGVTDPMAGLSPASAAPRLNARRRLADRDLHRHLHHHPGRRDAGGITNTGTATGTPPVGPDVSTNAFTVTLPRPCSPVHHDREDRQHLQLPTPAASPSPTATRSPTPAT